MKKHIVIACIAVISIFVMNVSAINATNIKEGSKDNVTNSDYENFKMWADEIKEHNMQSVETGYIFDSTNNNVTGLTYANSDYVDVFLLIENIRPLKRGDYVLDYSVGLKSLSITVPEVRQNILYLGDDEYNLKKHESARYLGPTLTGYRNIIPNHEYFKNNKFYKLYVHYRLDIDETFSSARPIKIVVTETFNKKQINIKLVIAGIVIILGAFWLINRKLTKKADDLKQA